MGLQEDNDRVSACTRNILGPGGVPDWVWVFIDGIVDNRSGPVGEVPKGLYQCHFGPCCWYDDEPDPMTTSHILLEYVNSYTGGVNVYIELHDTLGNLLLYTAKPGPYPDFDFDWGPYSSLSGGGMRVFSNMQSGIQGDLVSAAEDLGLSLKDGMFGDMVSLGEGTKSYRFARHRDKTNIMIQYEE